jgi:multidrug efflux system membrane fusion protein
MKKELGDGAFLSRNGYHEVMKPSSSSLSTFCSPLGGSARTALVGFLVTGLMAAGAGCGNANSAALPAIPPGKVNLKRSVELGQVQRRSIQYSVETPGIIEAERVTDIAAGVSGIVDEVLFREGQAVTPDTVLILVDQKRFTTQLDIAKADEQRAKAALEQARDAAQRAFEARGAITEEERIRTRLVQKTAEANLASSEASRRLAEIQLERSHVRPPYAGRINQRKVTAGSYIEDKTPVATIADVSHLRLTGWVPESAAAAVRQRMTVRGAVSAGDLFGLSAASFASGQLLGFTEWMMPLGIQAPQLADVEFTLLAYPRQKFLGRLFYLSTVANPETHMFESKAEILGASRDGLLQAGYTARIRIPLRTLPDACVVPEEAVRPNERGFVAFVPVQKPQPGGQPEWVAQARILELGYREPGWVEVKSGLTPGELIIRRGAEALEDGTPIQFAPLSPGASSGALAP